MRFSLRWQGQGRRFARAPGPGVWQAVQDGAHGGDRADVRARHGRERLERERLLQVARGPGRYDDLLPRVGAVAEAPPGDVAARASGLDTDASAARLPGEDVLYRGVPGTASGDTDQGLVGPGDGVCVRAVPVPQVYAFIRARRKPEGARSRPLPVTYVSSPTGFSDVHERIDRGGGGLTPL